MKKWLSLVVMTGLILGAAYFAVATETGRNVLNSNATTRAMLVELDAMLAKNAGDPVLLAKRDEIAQELAKAGETVAPVQADPNYKSPEYLRSIGAYEDAQTIEDQQAVDHEAYVQSLIERLHEGATLTEAEKLALAAAGQLEPSVGDFDGRDRLDDAGGPDGSGYRFVDNLGGDTATFGWIELCGDALATELLTTDDNFLTITWAWNFPFYGTNYTTGYVNSNGQLRFVTGSSSLSNADISATNTTPWISGFWDDLDPDGGGPAGSGCAGAGDNEVRWRDFGDKVVVSWTNTPHWSESTDRYNFQIIIYPDGKIKLQYNTNWVNGGTGSTSSSIHIDGVNADGVSYLHNGAPANRLITNAGRAIWFYQLSLNNDYSCTTVIQPNPVRVSPGAAFEVIATFRNNGTVTQSSPVKYQFNGGAIVSEATAVLAQFQTENHDFAGNETAPLTIGDYPLLIWSDLATDADRANDTARVTVQVRLCYDESQTGSFVDAGTTCGALNDFANTCMGTADGGEDYIYEWIVPVAGNYNLRYIVPSATTLGFALSSSCPPDSFNCISSANLFQDTVSFSCVPLNAGTYYITVDRSTGCGTYTLQTGPCIDRGRCCYDNGANCVDTTLAACTGLGGSWDSTKTCANNPCPLILAGGETCAEAVAIPSLPFTLQSTTVGGIDDDPGFQCALGSNDPYEGFNTAPDKWYTIIGTGDTIFVSLCSAVTTFDTQILVVCSPDCQNYTCVAGNDDSFTGLVCSFSTLRSIAYFCSEVGREYYVVVDGWGAGNGPYELSITLGGDCAGAVDCAPTGRCCYLDNGAPACVDNLAADCSALGGQWNDAASCASTPCPVGRCCYVDNGLGACETNTQLECNALGGTWTSTTTCEATPCPTGRCCYDDNGTPGCVNEIIEVCNSLSGLWNSALTCEGAACPTVLAGADSCQNAVAIPAFNSQYVGTTVGFTGDANVPTACGSGYNGTAAGVWYKLVGTGNTITISMCDALTDYDSELFVFCNTCDTLTCVGGDDDFCATPVLASQVTFCSVLGAEYLVFVTAFGSTTTGNYAFTVTDDGVACTPTVVCFANVAPCDPVVDLRAYVVTAGGLADHLQVHFTAPQDETYFVWTTTNPNNDGNPNGGTDPDWTLETTLPGLIGGNSYVYDFAVGFPVTYTNIVVTADCDPTP